MLTAALPATTPPYQTNATAIPRFLLHPTAALAITALYLVAAAALLSNFDLQPFAPEKLGLVFNDMAQRLLRWDFSVDPTIISYEAFLRDGVTYPYYGIFPAFLRMPLIALNLPWLQVGRLSCLAALGLTVYSYLRLVQHVAARSCAAPLLVSALLLSAALTGPQMFLLASASLYHELIFWGAAFTAIFNLVVMRRWLHGHELTFGDLVRLALLAGLCLLCRVNAGAGLYLALLLLLVRHAALGLAGVPRGRRIAALASAPAWIVQPLAVGCLALVFVAALGVVNLERWGDPLAASPYQYYVQFIRDPANLARYQRHGLFSWTRVAVAAAYYSTGFKVDAVLPAIFDDYYGGIEGPRAVTPLAAPLLMLAAVAGAHPLLRRPRAHAVPLLLLAGNAAAVVLMLGFHALCLRYVFDAWGMVIVLAAMGLLSPAASGRAARSVMLVGALLLAGAVASPLMLLRYKINYSGTDPQVRYSLSQRIQPLLCPQAPLNPTVRLTDFIPLVTPACPPLW